MKYSMFSIMMTEITPEETVKKPAEIDIDTIPVKTSLIKKYPGNRGRRYAPLLPVRK